jgi:drug/metabolite transporter (DMT)-like permease
MRQTQRLLGDDPSGHPYRPHPAASTAALNFEPIALLGLAWVFLGQAATPLQILGAFVVVGAIVWLGVAKR